MLKVVAAPGHVPVAFVYEGVTTKLPVIGVFVVFVAENDAISVFPCGPRLMSVFELVQE